LSKDPTINKIFLCIRDNHPVSQERCSKLSDNLPSTEDEFTDILDDLGKGSSKLSDSKLILWEGPCIGHQNYTSKKGKRSSTLFDRNDSEPKLLDHKICDSEMRSSRIFRSQQLDTFLQKEKQKNITNASTPTMSEAYQPYPTNIPTNENENLSMPKRPKPDSQITRTPYELLVPSLNFKTEQTLATLTQDIINLIWEKYQKRQMRTFLGLQDYFLDLYR